MEQERFVGVNRAALEPLNIDTEEKAEDAPSIGYAGTRNRFETPDGFENRAARRQRTSSHRQSVHRGRRRLFDPNNEPRSHIETDPPIARSLNYEVGDDDGVRPPTLCIALGHQEHFRAGCVRGEDIVDGRHYLGPIDAKCIFCHCYKWAEETVGCCCREGDIDLPPFEDTPPTLKRLFDNADFLQQIRAYNMVFAFTSLGANDGRRLRVDESLADARYGVYTFRIQGTICHRVGSLLPQSEKAPAFARLCFFDPDVKRQANSHASIMNDLDVGIIRSVQEELFQLNAFAQTYKSVGLANPHQNEVQLRIYEDVRTDLRRYNKPTAVEVAGLIVNERVTTASIRREGSRDLLVERQGGGLLRIFCVDQYAKLEAGRVRYAQQLQKKHRMEDLSGVRDMAMNDVDDLGSTGKAVILRASFTGSDRYMKQHYYDAMAIVRCFGPPDLFITVTCNSKWQEIMENLAPRQAPGRDESTSTIQSPPDRQDLIARVFS